MYDFAIRLVAILPPTALQKFVASEPELGGCVSSENRQGSVWWNLANFPERIFGLRSWGLGLGTLRQAAKPRLKCGVRF